MMDEADFEHRLTAVEMTTEAHTERLEKIEAKQDNLGELVATVGALVVREENVETTVKEIKKDVKTLTNKPGQRWDSLVDKIIITLAAAVVGFILAKIGL